MKFCQFIRWSCSALRLYQRMFLTRLVELFTCFRNHSVHLRNNPKIHSLDINCHRLLHRTRTQVLWRILWVTLFIFLEKRMPVLNWLVKQNTLLSSKILFMHYCCSLNKVVKTWIAFDISV